jgi:Dot/Icm secretion system protein IcmQ
LALTPKEVKDQLLAAIDQAIEKGDWIGSHFLMNILKQLQDLRTYVLHELSEEPSAAPGSNHNLPQKQLDLAEEKEGYVRVYVSLYQSESDSLDRWFSTIKMLTGYGVSRPVYATEEEIQHVMRERRSPHDAYVSLWVKKTDIIPSYSGSPVKDRWGYTLLTLKEGSIQLQNIILFMHSGRRYYLTNRGLVLAA